MSETPSTYSCGDGCTCDAVTDLAGERTEVMEEMAAALESAREALRLAAKELASLGSEQWRMAIAVAREQARLALAKYHDR